jgi:hypothetical protein
MRASLLTPDTLPSLHLTSGLSIKAIHIVQLQYMLEEVASSSVRY